MTRTSIAKRLLTLDPRGALARFRSRSSTQSHALDYAGRDWRGPEPATTKDIEAQLHKAAALKAGYHDFGDAGYHDGLGRLLESIDSSGYTVRQRERIQAGIVPVLTGRLYSERGWYERPDCLTNPIDAPLVICGLPRSGTTALHKLLSMDQRFQGLNAWLIAYPMPRPPRSQWAAIPEFRAVEAGLSGAFDASPTQKAAHFRTADEVDECLVLMSQSFVTNLFPAGFRLPEYDEWFRVQDQRPTYKRLADNLKLIGSNEPGKPWLLKNPGHILALSALLDVFPDARIVHTHRHPRAAMASITSLLAAVRRSLIGADVSVDDIAGREVRLWSEAVQNAMAAREQRPQNFHDVDFREFVAEPMAVARGIYNRFGMDLDVASELAMREWISENPQGKHGAHTYSGDALGVSGALIDQQFSEYVERFGLD